MLDVYLNKNFPASENMRLYNSSKMILCQKFHIISQRWQFFYIRKEVDRRLAISCDLGLQISSVARTP